VPSQESSWSHLPVLILFLFSLFMLTWRVVYPEDFKCSGQDCLITHPNEP
jgi:hypothetical protein